MQYRIEVRYRDDVPDAEGHGIVGDVADLGITSVDDVRTAQVYWVIGDIGNTEIEQLCSELLTDTVTQIFHYAAVEEDTTSASESKENLRSSWIVDVRYRPGVTDTVGDSVLKGIRDMGIEGVQEAHTGQQYMVQGRELAKTDVEVLSRRLLANELIQTISVG